MCQDHLCRLGFCLSCWQRDLCMEELNNSELLMPGWVSSILIIHWHLSLLQTKANQPVRVLKATWAISIHRWVPVISAIDAAQCPRAPFFPQHNLEPPVISLLWCYALPPTEISCSSQLVGDPGWEMRQAVCRVGCEGWNSPLASSCHNSPLLNGTAALPHCRVVWVLSSETVWCYRDGTARRPETGTCL